LYVHASQVHRVLAKGVAFQDGRDKTDDLNANSVYNGNRQPFAFPETFVMDTILEQVETHVE